MLSFDDMQKKYGNVGTIGQQLKAMSDEVMQETFDNDIQTRQCYIYDYYHDDQADMEWGYNPALSETKIPVKLKFIIKSYKSIAKDEPDYHIMFEPDVWNSMSCKPDWFVKNYEKLGIEFPIGLYVDIPDDRGVYHKWIVMYTEVANQFPKFGVLRCNYLFMWVKYDGIYRHKRRIWGVDRTQNSYTAGTWTGDKFTVFDEQDKFYLPWSPIAAEIKHDMRLFISMIQPEPYVYIVTKVDNTSPKGVVTYTVKQDRFEANHDYVSADPNNDDYGDMYADYYSSDVEPCNNDSFDCNEFNYNKYTMVIEAVNDNVKLGASKVLTTKIYDGANNDITDEFLDSEYSWNFELVKIKSNQEETTIDEEILNSLIVNKETWVASWENDTGKVEYGFKCKFKFVGDEQYVNDYNISVTCTIENMTANISLDIVTL